MGCFSWMFANWDNQRRMRIDQVGYLHCPNGTVLKADPYEGYGEFDGQDVYDLVADWNRIFLSENPDHVLAWPGDSTLSFGRVTEPMLAVKFPWYRFYSDLSLTRQEVVAKTKEVTGEKFFEYRDIGIELACNDLGNESLLYPIKICSKRNCGKSYKDLPASKKDPDQGF